MTQEVQPLAWQKRTNLEEHQQFFSKINEIIANLAPTVTEAEAAIAQATQAIASANAAINTANAASASADAASQQAQTAATTVAGYNDRLTTAESDIGAVTLRVTTAEGQIVTIQGRVTALETADGQNVKINRINEYAVGLTGNQSNIAGDKTFLGLLASNKMVESITSANGPVIVMKYLGADLTDTNVSYFPSLAFYDANDQRAARITVTKQANGRCVLTAYVRNSDGTQKAVDLAAGDVIV